MKQKVRDFLAHSPAANAVTTLDLGAGRQVTIWEHRDDRVFYDGPQGHAFSLYLQGGYGTRRLDRGAGSGQPGTVCILPEGHRSNWEITTPCRFIHLYMPDDRLRSSFAAIHDRDARQLDLPEVTFAEMPGLTGPLNALAQAAMTGDRLLADTGLAELIGQLGGGCRIVLRGGLPPRLLRLLDDWIEVHLGETIRLEDLARIADLSPFHLNRMFKASKGIAPHAWITLKRIDCAKAMLRDHVPIIETALACGFSSQSHFTRTFRAHTGTTPAIFRLTYNGG